MSFIIKALRKVEKEKAAAREAREVKISSAILSTDKGRASSERTTRRLISLSFVVFAILCGALYLFIKAPASKNHLQEKTSETRQVRPPTPPVAAVQNVEGPSPATKKAEIPERAERKRGGEPEARVPATEAAPLPAIPSVERRKNSATRHFNDDSDGNGDNSSVAAPSNLIVNGIALQDDPRLSVAIVNGKLLKSGMTIDGFQIERIFVDRVRFRGNGGNFEVHISK
jgi:hypothetical protein